MAMRAARCSVRRLFTGVIMMIAVPCGTALAEELPAWCPALRDVAALVRAKDRVASIIGRPREGSFFDTTLPLPGWADCSFYGRRTYVCDSRPLASADAVSLAFAKTRDDVKTCLRETWTEDPDRASPGYAVIRDDRQVASITINTDQTGAHEYVVRLILFLRSR
jgi:hypothetical protein